MNPPRFHVAPIPGESSGAPPLPTLLALVVAGLLYGIAWRRQVAGGRPVPTNGQAAAFLGGLAAMAWALLGWPERTNEASLFGHMVQHVALVQLALPLVVVGRPAQVWAQGLPNWLVGPPLRILVRAGPLMRLTHVLGHPALAWLAFNGAMVFWHLPRWHNLALADPRWHAAEHACFVVGALVFWRAVLDPSPRPFASSAHGRMLLCFASGMVGDLIALPLTLAPRVLYTGYSLNAVEAGLDPLVEQSRAGLLMWLSGGLFYLVMLAIPAMARRERPT